MRHTKSVHPDLIARSKGACGARARGPSWGSPDPAGEGGVLPGRGSGAKGVPVFSEYKRHLPRLNRTWTVATAPPRLGRRRRATTCPHSGSRTLRRATSSGTCSTSMEPLTPCMYVFITVIGPTTSMQPLQSQSTQRCLTVWMITPNSCTCTNRAFSSTSATATQRI